MRLAALPSVLILLVAPLPAAQNADVTVELELFGVGGVYRPGDIVPIRLALTSMLDEPTPCWVQWEVPNAEGDIAEYGRSVTLTPGSPVQVWLYARVPPLTTGQTIWTVRVFEERDERRGRELGGAPISPALATAMPIDMTHGAVAVIGRNRMGLSGYRTPRGPWRRSYPPGAHEQTQTVLTLPTDLPDRWEGLMMFEAVAWADALPQELRLDASLALREYVRRGGHLIIDLPQAGNPWGLGTVGRTYFDDLLPSLAPRTDEGVELAELMPVLSKTRRPRYDIEVGIRVFGDNAGFDAADNDYEPLIALPDGRVVAIQRIFGHGRITLIGIELTSQLATMGLPEADVFWNRVLGRRQDTPALDTLIAMDTRDPRLLTRAAADEIAIGDGRLFQGTIDKTRTAASAMIVTFLLFAAYLLLAGPVGFFMLKQQGLVRHAWLVFAGTAAVFTAVTWGGVKVLRTQDVELRHVTVLDHIARAPGDERLDEPLYQRAVSWTSLYLQQYGTARLAIESDARQRDLLTTWWAPEKPPERFPNVDRYVVDIGRNPAEQRIPVRATATQLYLNWLGALDPDWGGMIRPSPQDPIRVVKDPLTGRERLEGTVRHDLPGPLTSVRIIWVTADRNPPPELERDGRAEQPWTMSPGDRGRKLLNEGHMWSVRQWDARDPYLLSTLEPSRRDTALDRALYDRYVRGKEGDGFMSLGPSSSTLGPRQVIEYLEMLSFYHHITPPKYHRVSGKDPRTMVAYRRLGRELDLSPWLARPCLIIIGYLNQSETPVPLTVDGEAPPSDGLTMVRWIYPLPVDAKELKDPRPSR